MVMKTKKEPNIGPNKDVYNGFGIIITQLELQYM
jgi:hypothetical protein